METKKAYRIIIDCAKKAYPLTWCTPDPFKFPQIEVDEFWYSQLSKESLLPDTAGLFLPHPKGMLLRMENDKSKIESTYGIVAVQSNKNSVYFDSVILRNLYNQEEEIKSLKSEIFNLKNISTNDDKSKNFLFVDHQEKFRDVLDIIKHGSENEYKVFVLDHLWNFILDEVGVKNERTRMMCEREFKKPTESPSGRQILVHFIKGY